jgi:hypothetical protein
MTPLDTLAPDQRAVLELVLRQGRSYGELSELLAIPEHDVRARAEAGLRALAGRPAAGVDTGRIADWLLGQQPEAEAERTRAAVGGSDEAREWAAVAAERLRELGGGAVPDVAAPAAPRDEPRPPAEAVPRASKLGGAVLIAVLALVVGGFLVWFLNRGDDETSAAPPEAAATPTATPTATGNDIVLRGTGDSNAAGLMRLIRSADGTVQFALAAQNVPANKKGEVYAVWFTRQGGKPRRLGFAQGQVGEQGVLTTGGPKRGDEAEFPRWFATYDKVLITRETDARGTRPGPAVLEGTLPAGG